MEIKNDYMYKKCSYLYLFYVRAAVNEVQQMAENLNLKIQWIMLTFFKSKSFCPNNHVNLLQKYMYSYNKVKGSKSVFLPFCVYQRISLSLEPIWFSFTV